MSELQRGINAAKNLINSKDHNSIMKNYGYSKAAPDQTDFDKGYQKTIKDWYYAEQRK